jgi:hypothetical protein
VLPRAAQPPRALPSQRLATTSPMSLRRGALHGRPAALPMAPSSAEEDDAAVLAAVAELAVDLEAPLHQLPAEGLPAQFVADVATALKAADPYNEPGEGLKKWGGIYHATGREGEEGGGLEELQATISTEYLSTNALYAGLWPSIQKFEREIVAMTVAMLNGGEDAVGLLTSGGTESILLPILGYREWGKLKGITEPEIICGDTAHPALAKACFYFGVKLVVTTVDPVTQRIVPDAVRAATTPSTIAIYASAPNFPNGRVDPIVELGEYAVERGLGLHVDNCLGGFYLSFAQQAGLLQDVRWDFGVPGVTTISVDVHKYGMAAKGVSVVAFADAALRRGTFYPVVELLGTYITPTMQGSRNGVGMAIAWATMVSTGQDGYRKMARDVHSVHTAMKAAVNNTGQNTCSFFWSHF